MKKYVLDACALVALFNDEEGADVVERLFIEALQGKCFVLMNKYNLLEVYYGYMRDNGEEFAENILSIIKNSCIHVNDVLSDNLLRQAGKFKTMYKISLADAMALAQTSVEQGILVTKDHHEMDIIEKEGRVLFQWIV